MFALASQLTDVERKRECGAFFGSMHRTLNHILWGDRMWLGRFTSGPCDAAPYGADMFDDFAVLVRERDATDTAILAWAGRLTEGWLGSTLEYRAASDGRRRQIPAWIAATHLFQHATHHRGQVTTLLRQSGLDPGVTDLPYLPGIVQLLE